MSTELAKETKDSQLKTQNSEFVRPHYEVENKDHAYHVHVFMPGVTKSETTITLEKDTLTIEARKPQYWEDSWKLNHREINTADYQLILQIKTPIDENDISASHENGVLTVVLPVAEVAKPKTITIE
jgi:HSP20 family protein